MFGDPNGLRLRGLASALVSCSALTQPRSTASVSKILLTLLGAFCCLNATYACDQQFPVVNRPKNFSFVAGAFFRIRVSVDKTTVRVERPFVLTLQITGKGRIVCPPKREKLQVLFTDLRKDFHIRGLPTKDVLNPSSKTWTFRYELRPKSTQAKKIPSLLLSFYARDYSTTSSVFIPLKILPPLPPKKASPPRTVIGPEDMYEIETGSELLLDTRRQYDVPSLVAVALCFLVPLGVCVGWYVVWRYRYPDEALRTKRRESRAARNALHALRRVAQPVPSQCETIVASYLQERFDFNSVEPTPEETKHHLERLGIPSTLCGATAEFFRTSQTYRFAPTDQVQPDWKARVTNLIRELEEDHAE
ncbi:MAG: BatD family protein [Gemmataceae bacterium]